MYSQRPDLRETTWTNTALRNGCCAGVVLVRVWLSPRPNPTTSQGTDWGHVCNHMSSNFDS